jgi:hypothetical protein
MGVASYREDDLMRFLEATEGLPILGWPTPPRHHCPFCAETFEDRHALSDHLASIHRGERPVLMIGGREPDQTSTIRQPLRAAQIAVENCSAARVRLNSAAQPEMPPIAVLTLLSEQTDAVIDLVLINRFDEVAAPVQQPYRLILHIPDKASLDAVDRAFIEHLARGMPQMAQVAAFLGDPLCRGAVSDYAEALGSYVRGLLVKDQAPDTGVTLPPAEADDLYGAALEVLKGFRRPLSAVVCGLVRFALNDFGLIDRPTGFRRLDRCNATLAPLLGLDVPPIKDEIESKSGAVVKLCPFDQAIDRVLDLSERLDRQTRWGPTLHEECRQTADARTLVPRDRVKVHALWAATALRFGADTAALEPLRHLRAVYPFDAWAAGHLDRMGE